MGRKKHVARLKEYARRTGAVLKYETVCKDGKQITMQAVINGERFPCALGENVDKAKNNAAKSALRCLNDKENQRPVGTNTAKKSALTALPVKQKKKANQIYEKICSINIPKAAPLPAGSDDGAAARLPELQISADFWADESKRVEGDSDSSNPPNFQAAMCPEEMNPGNGPSETPKILRNKSEFELHKLLGKGAFGRVYKVFDKNADGFFAIKIIACKETRKALREVQFLSKLNHCNIIRYHCCWIDDSGCLSESTDGSCSTQSSNESPVQYLYIQMELCDKKTLKDWIEEENAKKSRRVSKRSEESLKIALQIVRGVEYIHSEKLIHRDLKPANIMFGKDGNVKIGDFGLVTPDNDNDQNPMERTAQKGTPSYMAPEQAEKTYNRKVDIFPLGLIYFELLWKIKTFSERAAIWVDIRGQRLPAEFRNIFTDEYFIIRPMLSMNPDERPKATEVKNLLDQFTARLNSKKLERQSSRTF